MENKTYIIQHKYDTDPYSMTPIDRLYWNNKDGWGYKETATPFTKKEKQDLNLPTNGEWIEV